MPSSGPNQRDAGTRDEECMFFLISEGSCKKNIRGLAGVSGCTFQLFNVTSIIRDQACVRKPSTGPSCLAMRGS